MKSTLTKIDSAVEQMDWAIRLFLDHRAPVPAITLAGAAEEIVAELMGGKSLYSRLKAKFRAKFRLPGKLVAPGYPSRAKNWLWHGKARKDGERTEFELEQEAIQHIVRALTNLVIHDRSLPSEAPRFFAWLARRQAAARLPLPPVIEPDAKLPPE